MTHCTHAAVQVLAWTAPGGEGEDCELYGENMTVGAYVHTCTRAHVHGPRTGLPSLARHPSLPPFLPACLPACLRE
jgi:hypothetical protein